MNKLNSLTQNDFIKGLIYAVAGGVVMAFLKFFQGGDFNIATANWGVIGTAVVNGAISSMVGYLTIKFRTDSEGTINLGVAKIETK